MKKIKINSILTLALIINIIFLFSSCKKDNPIPPDEQPKINLALADTSCTEAWIKLSTSNISLPANAEILKDDSITQTISLTTTDTNLYIDSLLPNHSYKFQSIIQSINQSSNSLSVTTMDTTSHSFTWYTWTFGGDAGSCTLYDVAIINENDIWAVGDIDIADTSINGYTTYNAVHWNGNMWEVKQVPYYYEGQPYYHPIQSIFAFDGDDIWFCGNGIIHWESNLYNPVPIPSAVWGAYQMNKVWGTSDNDIYIVGDNGNIVQYDGHSWTKIESGTELNINDIWGYSDNSGDKLILCAASDLGTNHQKKLLRISDNSVDSLNWQPQKTLFTVWPGSLYKIYAGGGKTYANSGNDWVEQTSVRFFSYKIRGNGLNDVYAVGVNFSHFNGYTWKEIAELSLSGGNYEGVATKGRTTCAVGYLGTKALVAIINK